jgi:hypothetical protein
MPSLRASKGLEKVKLFDNLKSLKARIREEKAKQTRIQEEIALENAKLETLKYQVELDTIRALSNSDFETKVGRSKGEPTTHPSPKGGATPASKKAEAAKDGSSGSLRRGKTVRGEALPKGEEEDRPIKVQPLRVRGKGKSESKEATHEKDQEGHEEESKKGDFEKANPVSEADTLGTAEIDAPERP